LIIILVIPNILFALTVDQKAVIKECYNESLFFGLEEVIPVICLIESSAGISKIGDDETSFGILQIKLTTAKWFLEKNDIYLSNKLLKEYLINDNKFSIVVACSYLNYLLYKNKGDMSKAVLSYNVGLSNVRKNGLNFDPNNYLIKFNIYKKLIDKEINF